MQASRETAHLSLIIAQVFEETRAPYSVNNPETFPQYIECLWRTNRDQEYRDFIIDIAQIVASSLSSLKTNGFVFPDIDSELMKSLFENVYGSEKLISLSPLTYYNALKSLAQDMGEPLTVAQLDSAALQTVICPEELAATAANIAIGVYGFMYDDTYNLSLSAVLDVALKMVGPCCAAYRILKPRADGAKIVWDVQIVQALGTFIAEDILFGERTRDESDYLFDLVALVNSKV